MKQKPEKRPASSERISRDIRRKTRKQDSAEGNLRNPRLLLHTRMIERNLVSLI